MSLQIDNGLILPVLSTTALNFINSNGDNLEITAGNGNIKLQTTSEVSISKNLNMGTPTGGVIINLNEYRGRSISQGSLNALSANLIFKTNNTNQLVISNAGVITYTKQPRLLTATSSTTSNQYMSMNNFMTTTSFTPTIFTDSGSGVINSSTSYGRYSRFGRIVFIIINIELSSVGTLNALETLKIGLPLSSSQNQTLNISKMNNIVYTGSISQSFDMYPAISSSDSYFTIEAKISDSSSTTSPFLGQQIASNSEIAFSGLYFV